MSFVVQPNVYLSVELFVTSIIRHKTTIAQSKANLTQMYKVCIHITMVRGWLGRGFCLTKTTFKKWLGEIVA